MWTHAKHKKTYFGNYEYLPSAETSKSVRVLRLEARSASGRVVGKVYTFSSHQAAKKAGWIHSPIN